VSLVLCTVEQLADAIREANATGTPLVDYGIFHAHLGYRPPQQHTPYTLTGDIVEHYVNDFTVTAHAGITMGHLNEQLMARNQFVPINADDDLTLGEVINHNMYGPMRVRYGSMRDQLLGLHYMDANANDIHVGGRTVKNVAGLDVTRLMIGAMGELGIVHQATLRTYALPQEVARIDLEWQSLDILAQQITDWMLGPAYPTSLHLRRLGDAWHLEVSYFGRPKANDVQVTALKNSLAKIDGIEVTDERRVTMAEHLKYGMQSRQWARKSKTLVKLIVPPSDLAAVTNLMAEMSITQITGMPAHGCLFAGGALTGGTDVMLVQAMEQCGGMMQWINPPLLEDGQTPSVIPFGPDQPDWPMLRKIKHTMDPQNIFNPGRFLKVEVMA
jgi:glycolate oxidase FAD binding subunit